MPPRQQAILSPVRPQAVQRVFGAAFRRDKVLEGPIQAQSYGANIESRTHGSR